ncbi:hypothetical protein WJX82_005695 [Trebouxia sp. C0006]
MDLDGVDHSRWQQLESICLMHNPVSNTGRPTLKWHQLIEANWPMLSSLELYGNRINAVMLSNIVDAQFSSIKRLASINTTDSSLRYISVDELVC